MGFGGGGRQQADPYAAQRAQQEQERLDLERQAAQSKQQEVSLLQQQLAQQASLQQEQLASLRRTEAASAKAQQQYATLLQQSTAAQAEQAAAAQSEAATGQFYEGQNQQKAYSLLSRQVAPVRGITASSKGSKRTLFSQVERAALS